MRLSSLFSTQRWRHRWALLMILPLWFACPATVCAINARLSRNPVNINESFQLILQSDGNTDQDPDFSVLEQDFHIVAQNQSQNIQMINGNMSRSTTWELTLMARRTGQLTIPAIRFGTDSNMTMTIQVNEAPPPQQAAAGDDIFIKVETTPAHAYQGQQILLRAQLYRAVNTDRASLSQPEADDPDILIKKLGDDEQYEIRSGGRRYLVVERTYALFSHRSGTLNLAPLVFQGEVPTPGSRRDNFFGSPFGRFGAPGEIRRVESAAIRIEIERAPALAAGEPWLPSSNLQIVQSWGEQQPHFRVGEPVTRSIMLFADGLTAAQLPEIDSAVPEGLKLYPDQPVLRERESRDGITGIREFKFAIVPSRSGSFTLPAITLDWWNIGKRRMERASIPAQHIEVLPAAATPLPDSATASTPLQPERPAAATLNVLGMGDYVAHPGWALFLGLGWLGTALSWWLSARRTKRHRARHTPPSATNLAADRKALRSACLADDPHAAARELLNWGHARWPALQPLTLGAIADKATTPGVKSEIAELERTLYAATALPWRGAGLWQQLELMRDSTPPSAELPEPLAPLHPI